MPLHFHLVQGVAQGGVVIFQHGTVKVLAVLEQKRHIEAKRLEYRLTEKFELVANGVKLPEQNGVVRQAIVQALLNKLEGMGKKMGIRCHESLGEKGKESSKQLMLTLLMEPGKARLRIVPSLFRKSFALRHGKAVACSQCSGLLTL